MENEKATTIFLIKPDAIQRGLVTTILHLLENAGFSILERKVLFLNENDIRSYQPVMNEPSEFGEQWKTEVIKVQTSGPSLALLIQREFAISTAIQVKKQIRTIYSPGSHYSSRVVYNLVHCPDNPDDVTINMRVFFPDWL